MAGIVAYTQADILALFSRIYPVEYWQPIFDRIGDGLEIYQAIAKVFSLVSAQTQTFWEGSLLTLAPAGKKAQATVELFRSTFAAGAVTVLAGSTVSTSNGGRDFVTLSDVVFGPTDLGPFSVTVESVYPDDDFNVPGQDTSIAGETIPGSIDTLRIPLQNPVLQDLTIQVRQITDATGGIFPWLEQLGADRGLPRLQGEPEEVYRWRIRTLPRVVTPNAIRELINGIFAQIGLTVFSIEQHSMAYQTCYDGPPTSDVNYDSTLFVYDDPRNPMPFRNRWLTTIEARGAFVVIVPALPSVQQTGFICDDPIVDATYANTVLGKRAFGALDIPSGLFEQNEVQEPCVDGFDFGISSFYGGLLETLNSVKAYGVDVSLELQGE